MKKLVFILLLLVQVQALALIRRSCCEISSYTSKDSSKLHNKYLLDPNSYQAAYDYLCSIYTSDSSGHYLSKIDTVIKKHPNEGQLYFLRALANTVGTYYSKGIWDDSSAIKDFEIAAKLGYLPGDCFNHIGSLYFHQTKYELAELNFTKAITLGVCCDDFHPQASLVLLKLKKLQVDEAIALFKEGREKCSSRFEEILYYYHLESNDSLKKVLTQLNLSENQKDNLDDMYWRQLFDFTSFELQSMQTFFKTIDSLTLKNSAHIEDSIQIGRIFLGNLPKTRIDNKIWKKHKNFIPKNDDLNFEILRANIWLTKAKINSTNIGNKKLIISDDSPENTDGLTVYRRVKLGENYFVLLNFNLSNGSTIEYLFKYNLSGELLNYATM